MRKSVLIVVAVSMLPLIALFIVNDLGVRQERELQVREQALKEARNLAKETSLLFEGAGQLLDAVATSAAVVERDRAKCQAQLGRLLARQTRYISLAVLTPSGDIACRHDGVTGRNFSDRSYFKEAVAAPGMLVLSEMLESRITGTPTLATARAYSDEAGVVQSVVVASLDLQWLAVQIASRSMTEGGSLTIADQNGTILARKPLNDQFFGTKIPDSFIHLITADEPGVELVNSQDGTRRFLGYVPVSYDPVGLYVSAGIAIDPVFADLNASTMRTVLVAIVAAIFATAAAALIVTLIGRKPPPTTSAK